MSRINAFKCDSCFNQADANYNGAHHLPPSGWLDLYDSNLAKFVGHLCDICVHNITKTMNKNQGVRPKPTPKPTKG